MPPPNILYIHGHDVGRYVQPYGHAVPTPHIQQLAEEGVLFRKCFCAAPTCSPSRAALLTGQYAHQNGMVGLAHLGFALRDYDRHLLRTLSRGGYTTALAGIQHEIKFERTHELGYDHHLTADDEPTEEIAAAWLSQQHDAPFFFSVGFYETHRVFPKTSEAEDARYTLPPAPLPDTPETREDMAQYKASAWILDAKIGVVLNALKENGLAENTLVVCTTDHGIPFPQMKCSLKDDGIGVMLIVRGPGGYDGGQVCDALVSHLDIYPTLCDLAGIALPDWLEGRSLTPLIQREVSSIREEIHAEVNYHVAYEPQRCVRTERYKYIRFFDDRRAPVLPHCDKGLSKSMWHKAGWTHRAPDNEALFDCLFDPHEQRNLVTDAEHSAVLTDMRRRLDAWMERTDDELLRGQVRAPADARIGNPDGVNPGEGSKSATELGYA